MPSPTPRWARTSPSAVVLRPDAAATPKDIRQFAIGRIADFKVPRQVLVVKEIPKGPTGKVQRIGLAAKLGLADHAASPQAFVCAAHASREDAGRNSGQRSSQVEQIGIHDDFFALGGDSLLATRVLIRMHEIMHLEVEVSRFFEAPTVAEMARHLETLIQAGQALTAAFSHCPRSPGKWSGASLHRAGTAVEAAASAARTCLFSMSSMRSD